MLGFDQIVQGNTIPGIPYAGGATRCQHPKYIGTGFQLITSYCQDFSTLGGAAQCLEFNTL